MKRKRNKKIIAISVIAMLCLFIGGIFLVFGSSEKEQTELEKKLAGLEIEKISERPDDLPKEMYEELPEFPKDFYKIRVLVQSNIIKDLSKVEPQYWLQPEFYPHWNEQCLPLIQNPPIGRWAPYGYGTFPVDSLAIAKPGDEFDVYVFVKSGCIVETYQGITFVPTFPESGTIEKGFTFPDGTKTVVQNPEIGKYFEITFHPENPLAGDTIFGDTVILEPSFPKWRDGWVYKVRMRVKIKPDAPGGKYILAMDITSPSEEFTQDMYWRYKNAYVPDGMFGVGRPWYRLFLEIE